MRTLGIDIAGGPGKSLDLALVDWPEKTGTPAEVRWSMLPIGIKNRDYPVFDFPKIAAATAEGNLSEVSTLTLGIVSHVCQRLGKVLEGLEISVDDLDVVAIDSPSGFSRNQLGHGRATEKVGRHLGLGKHYQPYFQMTPSVACGRVRGNDWSWMMFGMASYHCFSKSLKTDPDSWQSFLLNGFRNASGGLGGRIIEVFPRATTQFIRSLDNKGNRIGSNVDKALGQLRGAEHEAETIRWALNKGNATGSDRADALLAALTALGIVYPDQFKMVALRHNQPSKYAPIPSDWDREGVIYVLGA